jgi:copper chaperone
MKTIGIKGMSCGHCVSAIEQALAGVDGVSDVKVSLEENQATFEERTPVDMNAVKEAVEDAGYELA